MKSIKIELIDKRINFYEKMNLTKALNYLIEYTHYSNIKEIKKELDEALFMNLSGIIIKTYDHVILLYNYKE